MRFARTGTHFFPSTGLVAAWMLILFLPACRDLPRRTWPETLSWVRSEFPNVEQISTDELARRLDASEDEQPLLIDTRTPEEYRVSHLKGAFQAQSVPEVESLVAGDRETPVVLYCSVGYRSSRLAAALMDAGFTHVRNLEGSIFKWADEGRPVYRDGRPVREVHPYDDDWGQLLERSLWAR